MSPMKSRKNIPAPYLMAAKRMRPVLAVKMSRGNDYRIRPVEKFGPDCFQLRIALQCARRDREFHALKDPSEQNQCRLQR